MTAPNPAWSGWLKVGADGWRQAVVSPSWDDCWRLLLQSMSEAVPRDAPIACTMTVEAIVNRGVHPDARKKPR
jgi:hypothetical protein